MIEGWRCILELSFWQLFIFIFTLKMAMKPIDWLAAWAWAEMKQGAADAMRQRG